MKLIVALFLFVFGSLSFANSTLESCIEERDEKINACKEALKFCQKGNPESDICFEIFDNCTTRAHEEFHDCNNI